MIRWVRWLRGHLPEPLECPLCGRTRKHEHSLAEWKTSGTVEVEKGPSATVEAEKGPGQEE